MKEQKNIERLFQEKFKDFEALPPQDSWNTIASKLKEKKKKRVVPFWFQLSGIAASLLIIGTLIWNFKSEDTISNPNNSVVFSEEIKDNVIDSNEVITSVDENKIEGNNNQEKINNIGNSKNKIVNQSVGNENATNFEKLNHDKIQNSNNKIVSNNKKSDSKRYFIASKDIQIKEEINSSSEKNLIATQKDNKSKNKNLDKIEKQIEEEENAQTKYTANDDIDLKEIKNLKLSINSSEINIKDSTLIVEIIEEKNPLEELLLAKENGENEVEKEKINKWAISTNASPIFFNSLAQGSSLDQQFDSNGKNYSTTLSYGVSGSYAINKKISVKAGINNINLSYNTNDVLYQTKLNALVDANNVPTISRNSNARNVAFTSEKSTKNNLSNDIENISQRNIGALKQEIGYVEVPLEITYKLIDKKFGIEVIGGMSTLFLNANSVSLVTEEMQMEVGKANNLNDVHFSTNVGLGFKYKFLGNFNANFQPMFKYQINTFSDGSGSFKPYFIGLYSGISFNF